MYIARVSCIQRFACTVCSVHYALIVAFMQYICLYSVFPVDERLHNDFRLPPRSINVHTCII